MLWPAVELARYLYAILHYKTELRRQDDIVTDGFQSFADDLLVDPRPVDLRGVKECHAAIERGPDQSDARFFVNARAKPVADAHAPKPKLRNLEAAIS